MKDIKGIEDELHKAINYHGTQRTQNEKNPVKHEYHRARYVELADALKEHQLNYWDKK